MPGKGRTYTYYPRAGKRLIEMQENLDQLNQEFLNQGGGTFTQATTPVILPPGGDYSVSVLVTIACATPTANIYYTLDGSIPDVNAIFYAGPFTLTDPATVNAIAIAPLFLPSNVAQEIYNVTHPKVSTPVFTIQPAASICANPSITPASDYFSGTLSITISTTTPGATIYYTVDGSTPTASSAVYSAPFDIASTCAVKAIAMKPAYANSGVTTNNYTLGIASAYYVCWATLVYPVLPTQADFEAAVSRFFVPGTLTPSIPIVCDTASPVGPYVLHVLLPIGMQAPYEFEQQSDSSVLTLYGITQGFDHVDLNGLPYRWITLTGVAAGTFRWYAAVSNVTSEVTGKAMFT